MKNAILILLQFLIWVFVSQKNASAQPRSNFTVGPATAKAGEKISSQIHVPAASDEGTTIPISVLHGARSGPVLAMIGQIGEAVR